MRTSFLVYFVLLGLLTTTYLDPFIGLHRPAESCGGQRATDDREWALSGLPVGAGWALSGRLLLIRVKYIIRCVDFESTQILYSDVH